MTWISFLIGLFVGTAFGWLMGAIMTIDRDDR